MPLRSAHLYCYRPDPTFGWGLWPGTAGMFTSEGHAFVRINSVGMRDHEHPIAKPAGVYRIAVLGDSYTDATQIPLDSTYWARLPGLLTSCGRPGVEVLNFGVAGYGTVQEWLMLHRASIYSPDLILLQITPGNDVRDQCPPL